MENSKRIVPKQWKIKSSNTSNDWIITVILPTWYGQHFSHVANGGLDMVLKLAKSLTCMTVASNCIQLTTMREQNKQI